MGHNGPTVDSGEMQEVKSKGRIIATVFRISPGARKFPRARPIGEAPRGRGALARSVLEVGVIEARGRVVK